MCAALGHTLTPLQPGRVLFVRLAKLGLPMLVLQHALFALRERSRLGWDVRMTRGSMHTSTAPAPRWQIALAWATPPSVIMQLTITRTFRLVTRAVYVATGRPCRLTAGHATLARTLTSRVLVAVLRAQLAHTVRKAPHHALRVRSMQNPLQAVPTSQTAHAGRDLEALIIQFALCVQREHSRPTILYLG